MTARNHSATAFLKFLDYVGERNLMKRNTVDSWRTASQKVLDALDESDKEDLRTLNVEQAVSRFENKAAGNYKPESLRVYKGRFSAALNHFLKWSDDPSGFKVSIGNRAGKAKAKPPLSKDGASKGISTVRNTASPSRNSEGQSAAAEALMNVDSLVLPIPLRPGVLVKVFGIPTDLSEAEARKITAVISAYAIAEK
jgi:hypothetical protein